VKVTGARSRRSINMQLSPPPGPRSLAMRRLVTEIRTPPPYSSPKTINEVLEVNTRPFRHGAFALHVPVTRYHPRALSSLSLDRSLNSSCGFARVSSLEICMCKFHPAAMLMNVTIILTLRYSCANSFSLIIFHSKILIVALQDLENS